jgi:hypothetical protein
MSVGKPGVISLVSVLFAISAGCGDEESKGGGASCEAVCKRIEAAHCGAPAPDCVEQCRDDNESTPVGCKDELDALSSCFAAATFTCDAEGVPTANGCKKQLDARLACDGQGGNQHQHQNQSGGLSCELDDESDVCDACLAEECCGTLSACGSDCQQLLDCADACADDSCVQNCFTRYPKGVSGATQISSCMETQCSDACE